MVICIAATNRPDVLDPALLRPGRFDRRVSVERPDRVGREQILRVHLQRRGLPLADDVCVSWLAATTTGFTGADLANLVNEAALLGGRRGKAAVGREEFDAAIMRAVAGIEKKRSILQVRGGRREGGRSGRALGRHGWRDGTDGGTWGRAQAGGRPVRRIVWNGAVWARQDGGMQGRAAQAQGGWGGPGPRQGRAGCSGGGVGYGGYGASCRATGKWVEGQGVAVLGRMGERGTVGQGHGGTGPARV